MSKEMTAGQLTQSAAASHRQRMLVSVYPPSDDAILLIAGGSQGQTVDGLYYTAADIARSNVETSTDGKKESVNLKLSNRNQGWAAFMATNGPSMNGCRVVLQDVFLDALADGPIWLFEGRMNKIRLTQSEFVCVVERNAIDFDAASPITTFDPSCQVKRFKDVRCGYAGAETVCDRTLTRCIALGNHTNFYGHPSVPAQMIMPGSIIKS